MKVNQRKLFHVEESNSACVNKVWLAGGVAALEELQAHEIEGIDRVALVFHFLLRAARKAHKKWVYDYIRCRAGGDMAVVLAHVLRPGMFISIRGHVFAWADVVGNPDHAVHASRLMAIHVTHCEATGRRAEQNSWDAERVLDRYAQRYGNGKKFWLPE